MVLPQCIEANRRELALDSATNFPIEQQNIKIKLNLF
jgi:hypothetical protein